MSLSPIILDLGCGQNKIQGALGVDKVDLERVDVQHDLSQLPYPFNSNSVDKVYCRHILEHFDVTTRSLVIDEIYRILKTGGMLEIRVPHVFSIGAFHDPTHQSFFTFNTMDYFTQGYPFSYYSKSKFEIIERWAAIQLFYNVSPKISKWKNFLNDICSKIFNQIFKISKALPDSLVKILPFYTVEIKWVLKKI